MTADDPKEYLTRVRLQLKSVAPDQGAKISVLEHAAIRAAVDKLLRYVKNRLATIEADGRFKQPPALVQVNAPLALIQVEMKAEYNTLTTVLAHLYKIIGDG